LSLSWVFWDFLPLVFLIFLLFLTEDVPNVSAMNLFLWSSSFICLCLLMSIYVY
jgi:hypothetical protein